MAQYVYDIEIYPNFFSATFIEVDNDKWKYVELYIKADIAKNVELKIKYRNKLNYKVFVCSNNNGFDNDIYRLVNFLNNSKLILYGFNSNNYDDLVLNSILIYHETVNFRLTPNDFLKKVNDEIIYNQDEFNYDKESLIYKIKYTRKPFIGIDLQSLNGITKLASLKFVAILYKWYRIQDLPYHFNKVLESNETILVLDYNLNDVLITWLVLRNSKEELVSRIDAHNKYNINCLSSSRAQLATLVIAHYYKEITGKQLDFKARTFRTNIHFDLLINKNVSFKTDKFKTFFNDILNTTIKVGIDKFSKNLIHDDLSYTFGKGGIHSNERPIMLNLTDSDDELIDADVASFYPRIILNNRIHPKHFLEEVFLKVVDTIVTIRLEAKRNGANINLAEIIRKDFEKVGKILKIVVNIIYGKLGDQFSPLYDLAAMYGTCLNGELGALMLIEELTISKFKIISANTDGFVTRVPKSRREEYYKICKAWEAKWSYELEYNTYIQYYGTNVNNYMAQYSSGKWKKKGIFNTTPEKEDQYMKKGFEMPIINHALFNYFAYNTPVEETIKNHKDIYDFCMAPKVKNTYSVELRWVEDGEIKTEAVTKTMRFYVSNKGKFVTKVHKTLPKEISVIAKQNITMFNNVFFYDNMDDYNINYQFYIKETNKFIYNIKQINTFQLKGTPTKSGISGTLFDNLNDES